MLQFSLTNEYDLTSIDMTNENAEKALGLFYKAFRILYNSPNWDVSIESCEEIISIASELLASKLLSYFKMIRIIN